MAKLISDTKDYLRIAVENHIKEFKLVQSESSLNNGIMTIEEFVDEMIMEFIVYCYQRKANKDSIRRQILERLDGNEDYDSRKMKNMRARNYIREYKSKHGENARCNKMDTINDKITGHFYNEVEFNEVEKVSDLRIIKAILERRIIDVKKVSNDNFIDMMMSYDGYEGCVNRMLLSENMTDEETIINSVEYWRLQWKYPIEVWYAIVCHMDENKEFRLNDNETALLLGKYKTSLYTTNSTFIKQRNSFVEKLASPKDEIGLQNSYYEYTLGVYLDIKACINQNYYVLNKSVLLREWFLENSSWKDWAEFLKDYNIFSCHQEKEWTNKRIRLMRELIKKCGTKREIPENHS